MKQCNFLKTVKLERRSPQPPRYGAVNPIYLAAGIAVLMSAGFFIYQALNTSLVYFILPSEYAKDTNQYTDRQIRLGGLVEEGSVAFDDKNLRLNFVVTDYISSYPVTHYGSPPELFEERTGVVVEGEFTDGVFYSNNLLIKHSEVYQAPENGEEIDIEKLRKSLE